MLATFCIKLLVVKIGGRQALRAEKAPHPFEECGRTTGFVPRLPRRKLPVAVVIRRQPIIETFSQR